MRLNNLGHKGDTCINKSWIYKFQIVMCVVTLFGGLIISANAQNSTYVDGEIIVGFDKNVSPEEAETILKRHNFIYQKPPNINISKGVFYECSSIYLVTVKPGKEESVVETLKREQGVKDAFRHLDANEVIID